MLGLEPGVGAELAGHEPARGRGQAEGSGLDGLRGDLARLADLDVLLWLLGRTMQPVGVPHQDGVGLAGPQGSQQVAVSKAQAARVG